jgi:hypothetical protein
MSRRRTRKQEDPLVSVLAADALGVQREARILHDGFLFRAQGVTMVEACRCFRASCSTLLLQRDQALLSADWTPARVGTLFLLGTVVEIHDSTSHT